MIAFKKYLPPSSQLSKTFFLDFNSSQNSITPPISYVNNNSPEDLSLSSTNSETSNQNDTHIQETKIINNELKNNNSLLHDSDSETDMIRINDDLSNLDDILNSSRFLFNNSGYEDLEKSIQKPHQSVVNTIPEIHTIPLLENEDYCEENWGNILMNPKKKKPVYLTPNRAILMRNLNSKSKTKSIGFIQNGNKSRFKSILLDDGNYVLSNTCAFDSVIQILAVAYCDSDKYETFVNEKKNKNTLWHLVFALLRDGLTVQTYRKRAKILKQYYPGEPMVNGVVSLSVEQAVDNLLIKLLVEDESVEVVQSCSLCGYKIEEKKQYLTVCVPERNITKRLLNNLLNTEIKYQFNSINCKTCSRKMIATPKFGNHIFFNLINLNNTMGGQFTDTSMRLNSIPKHIRALEEIYYFRGSVTTPDDQQGTTAHTTLGHYHAHTYRQPINIWQMYDDNKEKIYTLNENKNVNVQILMFSK